jgi:predicted kinase
VAETSATKRNSPLRHRDADLLESSLSDLPGATSAPALIVMIGLPGSGKSHFARQLSQRYPVAALDSDTLRATLFPAPEHSPLENRRLFPAMHLVIDRLLSRRVSVIVDATNLKEASRKPYYAIAKRRGARLLLARTWAPPAMIKDRLRKRESAIDPDDRSTATVAVYERMRQDVERISRRHLSVNTSKPLDTALDTALGLLKS